MRNFTVEKFTTTTFCVFVMSFSLIGAAFAETMSSTNYRIQTDAMTIGGGNSSSTNFGANDTIGDLSTGEGLSSTNYLACAGFECFSGSPYLTFSVRGGLSPPGSIGAGVSLGSITTSAVITSNSTSVNSIFLIAEGNGSGGTVVSVRDANGGLKRNSTPDTLTSSSASLVTGTAGYGICVFSATEDVESPTAFNPVAPYDGTCTKTTGHDVGALSMTPQQLLIASGAFIGGEAEVLVKASISAITPAGNDYADMLTFVATSTY